MWTGILMLKSGFGIHHWCVLRDLNSTTCARKSRANSQLDHSRDSIEIKEFGWFTEEIEIKNKCLIFKVDFENAYDSVN